MIVLMSNIIHLEGDFSSVEKENIWVVKPRPCCSHPHNLPTRLSPLHVRLSTLITLHPFYTPSPRLLSFFDHVEIKCEAVIT